MSDEIELPPADVDAATADRIRRGAQRELARAVESRDTFGGRAGQMWDQRVEPVLVGCVSAVYLAWAYAMVF